jgi:hypothetical protein
VATDILAVLIRLGLDWAGTDILAGLGLGLDGALLSVLGAHACARVRVRVRVRARNYGFILVLCLAGILFFFLF